MTGSGARAAARRCLPKTLLGRSVVIIVMPLVLLQAVSTWIFYDRHWNTVTRRLAGAVAGEIAAVIDARETFRNRADLARLMRSARDLGLGFRFDEGGVLRAGPPAAGRGILDRRLADAMQVAVERPFRIDSWSHERLVRMEVQLPDGVMRIDVPRKRLFSSTTYIFVMWMAGTSVLLFAVAAVFMRNQVRPIRRLARAVDSFGKGRDTPGFRPEGATEIRMAAVAFDRMRRRIQNALGQRTEMLAGVSHDLRTPLTRMKLQLEMLGESDAAAGLKEDVQEMEFIVEEFLAFARGEGTEDVTETDVGEIVRSVARAVSADEARLAAETDGDLRMPARPNAIRRCLTNLLTNALAHARSVRIAARRTEALVEVVVDDDGPGIPEVDREAAFKPFWRLDSPHGPDTGGIGLGLAIARDVARGHGGDVTLGDSPMGGLRATVELPV